MTADSNTGYNRIQAVLQKYENHRTPEDGEPDEVVTTHHYVEAATGEEVTDPELIAMLDARYEARMKETS